MKTTIYASSEFLKHDTGHNHPESAARLETLLSLFEEKLTSVPQKEPQAAEIEDIALTHPESYIYELMDLLPDTGYAAIDTAGECILSPSSWESLLLSAGAGISALNDIMSGETTRAFCAIRPPGHHAEAQKPMGFCFFNNAFITARIAQERHNIKHIAIIDFDVHHGNGTDALTRAHNDTHPNEPLFYASTHQAPLWPMTGDPTNNTDHIINATLPEGSDGKVLMNAYEEHIFPALNAYAPDLLILSAGFDAHKDDPLAGLSLEAEDFGTLTTALCAIADKHANRRMISLLEGGYNIQALKSSVEAHLHALSTT
ncbi:MAG: acetoin utilization protein [Micavibrio sp.]|nr:acetoin utilization protein [Micavibrio sp.]|tara:strand:+ start:339 stop:1283 length:945 start_codon:yes stop_codon:yes gene_type:complete